MTGEHGGLQAKIREQFGQAIFVHCYAHKLNLVLSQSTSFIKPVSIFFASLPAFGNFFSKSSKRSNALDEYLNKRFPSIAPTRWQYRSRLVETVHKNKSDIELLFSTIVENPNEWDSETIISAQGLLSILKGFEFNFFLEIFSSIFPFSDCLFRLLQAKQSDISFCIKKIEDFKSHLQKLREDFHTIWGKMEAFSSEQECPPRSKRIRIDSISGEDKKASYKRIFCEVIDVICVNISVRFAEVPKLKFLSLLDSKQFQNFQSQFPYSALACLKENYGLYFDIDLLKSELTVVYSDADMVKESVFSLHEYIRTLELTTVFPQTYKLCRLVLTIPATSATSERSFSALKRIKTYLRNAQTQERLTSLSLLNIEKELLDTLRSRSTFEDDVIEIFSRKNRRIELIFKK